MEKRLSFLLMMVWAVVVVLCAVEFSAPDSLAKTHALLEQFGASAVDVCYFLKPNEFGQVPDYEVKYLCPNCHSYHSRSLSDALEWRKPLVMPGFVVAADRVLTQSTGLRTEWISRIEVRMGSGASSGAALTAVFPAENAVELTLEHELEGARPLVFSGAGGEPKRSFYVVNDEGRRFAGSAPLSEQSLKYDVDQGFAFLECPVNTLILDEKDQPLALSFRPVRITGADFSAPEAWTRISAAEFQAQEEEVCAKVEKGFFPVEIILEPDKGAKNEGRSRWSSDDEESENSFETYGMLLSSGELLVFQLLSPMQTARLTKIAVKCPDGAEVPAQFVGSLRHFGLLVAKPETPLPGQPIELASAQEIRECLYQPLWCGKLLPAENSLRFQCIRSSAKNLVFGFQGQPMPESENSMDGETKDFTEDGKLCVLLLTLRKPRNSYSGSHPVPASVLRELLTAEHPYDLANAPRGKNERDKAVIPFGVQTQRLDKQLIRERKLEAFVSAESYYDAKGIIVTSVQSGSLAEKIGLQVDDVLLYFRSPDEWDYQRFEGSDFDSGYENDLDEFPWDRYDEIPEQYFEMVPQPWGSVKSKLNISLAKFGLGASVVVGFVRDNALQEKEFVLEGSADSFESAPRYRQLAMNFTVAEMTSEVREYFQIKPGEPGVVVAQVKVGGAAAGAGLKPYEIITAVDGEAVHNLQEFQEKIGTKLECDFTVRRLVNSHVVKIKGRVGPVAQ
ncbi:MAG: PDZ domain-containing protein [Victivallales bacterium]|nr:PDZ domain-containing protein [Victivallales bacterium]